MGGKWKLQSYIPPFSEEEHQTEEYHPLPVSALGTRYILSSCPVTKPFDGAGFMISSHKKKTDVAIAFKLEGNVTYGDRTYSDGDTLDISLMEYDSVSVKSSLDLSGIIISSSGPPIAVFSLNLQHNNTISTAQLLPVQHFGQEYVAPTTGIIQELQIISDYNDTKLVFNNRSSVTVGERRVYRLTIDKNENVYFNSTKSVMSILCRHTSQTLVPPVSLYQKQAVLPQTRETDDIIIVTENDNINLRSSLPVLWKDIPFSRFKAGKLIGFLQSSISFTSNISFTVLVYGYDFYSSGFDFSSGLSLQPDRDIKYVIPASSYSSVTAVAGENGGFWEVESEFTKLSFKTHRFYAGNSIIKVDGTGTKIYGIYNSENSPDIAHSVFQVADLGAKYIVASCHPPGNYTSVIVIATHNKTSIDITFRLDGNITIEDKTLSNGDIFVLNIEQYKSFAIRSQYDLSGTVVSSNMTTFAVFSGSSYNDKLVTFEQLIPVKHHGQEYVVAVDDNPAKYQMQIISEQFDAQIMFNNGSMNSVDKRGLYSQYLGQDEGLSFTTARPVMATLCRESAFAVIPPVESYVQETSIFYAPRLLSSSRIVIKILIKDYSDEQESNQSVTLVPGIPVEWKQIPFSKYIIGTATVAEVMTDIFISSKYRFTVTAFYYNDVYNGGYNFSKEYTRDNIDDENVPGDEEIPTVVIIVAGGTGVSVTTAMVCGGYALLRRRRRKQRRDDEREKPQKEEEQQKEFNPKDRPPHPPPGAPPPLART